MYEAPEAGKVPKRCFRDTKSRRTKTLSAALKRRGRLPMVLGDGRHRLSRQNGISRNGKAKKKRNHRIPEPETFFISLPSMLPTCTIVGILRTGPGTSVEWTFISPPHQVACIATSNIRNLNTSPHSINPQPPAERELCWSRYLGVVGPAVKSSNQFKHPTSSWERRAAAPTPRPPPGRAAATVPPQRRRRPKSRRRRQRAGCSRCPLSSGFGQVPPPAKVAAFWAWFERNEDTLLMLT